jgi:hypothetical protein
MRPTQRVGAHRSTSSGGWPRWAILLAGLAAAIVLAAGGLFALDMLRPQAPPPAETQAPEAIDDPAAIDPSLDASITVLNSSGEREFAAAVGQALADEGWDVIATSVSTPSDTTVVWFDSEDLGPVARGLVARLGVGEAQLSEGRLSGTPITIVLGPDAVGTAPSVEPHESMLPDPSQTVPAP